MKVSIIIPVYNSELYIHQCLDSILNQIFSKDHYELLLINDGSTDSSGQICDQYAAADKRVRVFHQKNAGVSAARNVGLDHARGEWILFVDSDDYLGQDYLNILEDGDEFDFAMVNVNIFENGHTKNFTDYPTEIITKKSFFTKFRLYPNFAGPWSKFFRRDIIDRNKLRFDCGLNFGEDALFNLQYLHSCEKIKVTNQTAYFYRESSNSLSKQKYNYDATKYLFDKLRSELYKYDSTIYLNHIVAPLSRTIVTLYNDGSLNGDARISELKKFMLHHKQAIQLLYQDSLMKFIFRFGFALHCYKLLDFVLQKKLSIIKDAGTTYN